MKKPAILLLLAAAACSNGEEPLARKSQAKGSGSDASGSGGAKAAGNGVKGASKTQAADSTADGSGAFAARLTEPLAAIVNQSTLTLNVQGDKLATYRFKLGPAATTDCTVEAGYSAATPASTPLVADASQLPDASLKLCLVGKSTQGDEQALSAATVFSWSKDTKAPELTLDASLSAVSSAQTAMLSIGGETGVMLSAKIADSIGACASDSDYKPVDVVVDGQGVVDLSSLADGPHVLCARAVDLAGNVTQKTAAWTSDRTAPTAVISDSPTGNVSAASVALKIGGSGIAQFRAKVGAGSPACGVEDGYSDPAAAPATFDADVASLPLGPVFVCVVASDEAGNMQAFAKASVVTFTRVGPEPAFGGAFRARFAFNDGFVNPYTNALSCPAGYTQQLVHEMTDSLRRFFCNAGNSLPCGIAISACWRTDLKDNTAGFYRTSTYAPAAIANPFTGAASCPTGYTAQDLLEFYSPNGQFYSSGPGVPSTVQVHVCNRDAGLGAGRSGGFYRKDNKLGVDRCTSANPFTSNCSCPSGYTSQAIHEFTVPGYYDGWSIEVFSCNK